MNGHCGIIQIREDQFSGNFNFLHVRWDVISFIGWLWGGCGGLKRKITLGKLILFSMSVLSLLRLSKSPQNDDGTGIATQVDLKTSTQKPLHVNWVKSTHKLRS